MLYVCEHYQAFKKKKLSFNKRCESFQSTEAMASCLRGLSNNVLIDAQSRLWPGPCACRRGSERSEDVMLEISVSVVQQKQFLETHYKIKWSASKRRYKLSAYRDTRYDVFLQKDQKQVKMNKQKELREVQDKLVALMLTMAS